MDKIIATYNQIAHRFADSRTPEFYRMEFKYFQSQLPNGSVIDVGCGPGRDARLFLAANYDYLGIDGSSEMIKIAEEKNPTAQFKILSFNELSQLTQSFDGFWATAAFVHTPKIELPELLANLQTALKPQAFGLISMKEMNQSWEGIVREKRYDDEIIERYFAYYSVPEFSQILTESGFEIVKYYNKFQEEEKKNWQVFFVRLK